MNVRHAAALALVGWYLMLPPLPQGKTAIDTSAPIGTWLILSSHDSAEGCEHAKAEALQKYSESTVRKVGVTAPTQTEVYHEPIVGMHAPLFATCIGTDDPRLAK
jgi:hypothetical protein